MILMPDPSTAVMDPFYEEPTLLLRCDVIEPSNMQGYERDPRSLAKRAEAFLKSTGLADASLWGPENEFFIFDSLRHGTSMNGCYYEIDSVQAAWNSGRAYEGGNMGHRPGVKGGYFPVPPVDAYRNRHGDVRAMEARPQGRVHPRIATACGERSTRANTLRRPTKWSLVRDQRRGELADRDGVHAKVSAPNAHHQHRLRRRRKNLLAASVRRAVEWPSIGIVSARAALNAICASTGNYKRLVPGFSAVMLACSLNRH
jgi:glutamine synthetase